MSENQNDVIDNLVGRVAKLERQNETLAKIVGKLSRYLFTLHNPGTPGGGDEKTFRTQMIEIRDDTQQF